MRKLLCVAAVAMFAAACGAAAGAGPGAGPTPTPSAGGPGYDQVVTDKDHQVTLHSGQKLEVVLHAGQGMTDWSHPVSSDTSILAPIVDPAATEAVGVTLAAFEARKPGEVEVSASARPPCPSPGVACPMYAILYRLKVVVTQ